jgi:cysteine desulfurase
MLLTSRVSRTLITRRAALRKSHLTSVLTSAKRTYVQPSGADRASVVDIPSTYQDESHFAPRAGNCYPLKLTSVQETD